MPAESLAFRKLARPSSDPILVPGLEQSSGLVPCARPTSCNTRGQPISAGVGLDCRASKSSSRLREMDFGAAEIRRIMQCAVSTETPTTTFLGTSPPARSTGAMNPLVQDALWRSSSGIRASHNNLQVLREIDEKLSFLRAGSNGDIRLLIGSPELGLLSDLSDAEDCTHYEKQRVSRACTPAEFETEIFGY